MCGIFGVINTKERIDESRVLAARDVLAHRGPDDAGIYFSNCHPELVEGSHSERSEESPFVALAHRRLSPTSIVWYVNNWWRNHTTAVGFDIL